MLLYMGRSSILVKINAKLVSMKCSAKEISAEYKIQFAGIKCFQFLHVHMTIFSVNRSSWSPKMG